jgi:hypothetical protein
MENGLGSHGGGEAWRGERVNAEDWGDTSVGGDHLEEEEEEEGETRGWGGVSPMFCRRNDPNPTQAHTHACMHIVCFIHALHMMFACM